jgi:hypothetical protein
VTFDKIWDCLQKLHLALFLEKNLKRIERHLFELERIDIEAGPMEDVDIHISISLDVPDHDSDKLIRGSNSMISIWNPTLSPSL